MKKTGLQGFCCPLDGSFVTLEKHCIKCPDPCKPFPVLATLLTAREIKPKTYSVTEILKPLQSIYLSRNYPYYLPPDALIAASLGIAWHTRIEKTITRLKEKHELNHYIYEEPFEVEINGVKLTGKPDFYDTESKTLWDFKTSAFYYTGKYLSEGNWEDTDYKWQLNMYRVYKFPDAKRMRLDMILKDWNRQIKDKYGVGRTLTLNVPFIKDGIVQAWVEERLKRLEEIQSGATPPPCTKEERWMNNKDNYPYRCFEYCGGKDYCPQFQEYLEVKNG